MNNQMKSLKELIRTRRSVKEAYTDQSVTKSTVLSLLNHSVWAPTHGKRQPWRFIFISPEDKAQFAHDISRTYSEDMQENREAYLNEPNAHLIVIMQAPKMEKQWDENFGAAASLIQNFSLLAWEQNLGVCWKTNPHIYDNQVRTILNINENEKIVGFLHLGYFDPSHYENDAKNRSRISAKEKLTTYPFKS